MVSNGGTCRTLYRPQSPLYILPGGARSLLGDGSFVDCTEIGTLFSCCSQILLIWIIQTDVKCFSKMENSCAFFLFRFGLVLAWGGLSGVGHVGGCSWSEAGWAGRALGSAGGVMSCQVVAADAACFLRSCAFGAAGPGAGAGVAPPEARTEPSSGAASLVAVGHSSRWCWSRWWCGHLPSCWCLSVHVGSAGGVGCHVSPGGTAWGRDTDWTLDLSYHPSVLPGPGEVPGGVAGWLRVWRGLQLAWGPWPACP